jgi:hypothetical protein
MAYAASKAALNSYSKALSEPKKVWAAGMDDERNMEHGMKLGMKM